MTTQRTVTPARRSLTVAIVAATLSGLGCSDAGTAPDAAPTTSAGIREQIQGATRPFRAGAADTTKLLYWAADANNYCDVEIRSVAFTPDDVVVDARGLYLERTTSACQEQENAELIEFRPRANTRESVNVELYAKNGWGILKRGMSKRWYYHHNGQLQSDNRDFYSSVTLGWTPVEYPVASRSVSPASVQVDAGGSVQLVTRAFAPNGVEIYNQPTSWWSSSNTGAATLASSGGVQTISSYSAPWHNWTNTVTGQVAGTSTISVQFGDQVMSVPVTVRPAASLSGSTWIPTAGSSEFTGYAGGCAGGSCTMTWQRMFASGHVEQLGSFEGTSSSVTLNWTGYGASELILTVTSNGVSTQRSAQITEQSAACAPEMLTCEAEY